MDHEVDNINVISTSDSNIIVRRHRLWAVETTTDSSRFGPPTLPRDAPDSLYGRDEEFCQRDWPSEGVALHLSRWISIVHLTRGGGWKNTLFEDLGAAATPSSARRTNNNTINVSQCSGSVLSVFSRYQNLLCKQYRIKKLLYSSLFEKRFLVE